MDRNEILKRVFSNSGLSEMEEGYPSSTLPAPSEQYPYSRPQGREWAYNPPSVGSVTPGPAQWYGGKTGAGGLILPSGSGISPIPGEMPSEIPMNVPLAQPAAQPQAKPAEQPKEAQQPQQAEKPKVNPKYNAQPLAQPEVKPYTKPEVKPAEQPESIPVKEYPEVKPYEQPVQYPETMPVIEPIKRREPLPQEMPEVKPERIPIKEYPEVKPYEQPVQYPETMPIIEPIKKRELQPEEKPLEQPAPIPIVPAPKPVEVPVEEPQIKPEPNPQPNPIPTPIPFPKRKTEPVPIEEPDEYERAAKTEVAVTGRNFADKNNILETERTIEGVSTAGKKIAEGTKEKSSPPNFFEYAWNYQKNKNEEALANPLKAAAVELGSAAGVYGIGNAIGTALAIPAAATPIASNILQFPTPQTATVTAETSAALGNKILQFAPRAAGAAAAVASVLPGSVAAESNWNPQTQKYTQPTNKVNNKAMATPSTPSTPASTPLTPSSVSNLLNKLNSAIKGLNIGR